jgi:redox-sensitive bicupin YhaK (pirin superfamily)
MNFGVLRVFNDDYIDGENGFGAHSHRDMEIVTIMLDGELTHADSMGNTETMKSGEVQYMSAGSGVTHSEVNNGKSTTHLYQIWLTPKEKSLKPAYNQKDFSINMQKNILIPVASDLEKEGCINIKVDSTIYMAQFESDNSLDYKIENNRGVFVYITSGSVEIGDTLFSTGDQARIENEENIKIVAKENTEFVLIDVSLE